MSLRSADFKFHPAPLPTPQTAFHFRDTKAVSRAAAASSQQTYSVPDPSRQIHSSTLGTWSWYYWASNSWLLYSSQDQVHLHHLLKSTQGIVSFWSVGNSTQYTINFITGFQINMKTGLMRSITCQDQPPTYKGVTKQSNNARLPSNTRRRPRAKNTSSRKQCVHVSNNHRPCTIATHIFDKIQIYDSILDRIMETPKECDTPYALEGATAAELAFLRVRCGESANDFLGAMRIVRPLWLERWKRYYRELQLEMAEVCYGNQVELADQVCGGWHGTGRNATADEVVRDPHGLDSRLSGVGMLGRGLYLAFDAAYSLRGYGGRGGALAPGPGQQDVEWSPPPTSAVALFFVLCRPGAVKDFGSSSTGVIHSGRPPTGSMCTTMYTSGSHILCSYSPGQTLPAYICFFRRKN